MPPFTENTPLDQAVHSPSRLVRAIVGELLRRRDRSMGAGHPDLEVLFIAQAPFRVLHKMTRLPREMAVPLLRVADGHVLAGLARVAWGFVHGTVANHRMARRFRRGAGVEHR